MAATSMAVGPAAASPGPFGNHGCDGYFGTIADDGVVTDVVHHTVEPLVAVPLYSDVHTVSCDVTAFFAHQNLFALPFRV